MQEKILVLDIDGTLTNSAKEISPETKRAIMGIQQRGHKVILASGRPTPGMLHYAKELEMEKFGGYLLSFNGARIVDCRTGGIVYQQTLPPFVLPGLYKFAREHACGLVTYCGDYIVSGSVMDEYVELEARINGMRVREVDDFLGFVDFEVNKCLMTAPPKEAEEYVRLLQRKYDGTLSIYRSEPFFIEIMPQNVDKGTSLNRMLATIGLKAEDTVCCGDGYNDITMVAGAGVGIAMANARSEVKQAADYITKSNDEDGLVEVIDKFIIDAE